MLSKRKLAFFFVLGFSFATISCHKTHAFSELSSQALLEIVRTYNPNNHSGQVLAAAGLLEPPRVSPEKLQTELEYASQIKQYFSQRNYDQLEKTIKEAREGKGRVLGGTWKVLEFYSAIHETFFGANPAESDWKMLFDSLNQWMAPNRESAAARISLAQAYMGYAWRARGGGDAGTVTAKGWELFRERVGMARATLV